MERSEPSRYCEPQDSGLRKDSAAIIQLCYSIGQSGIPLRGVRQILICNQAKLTEAFRSMTGAAGLAQQKAALEKTKDESRGDSEAGGPDRRMS